MKTWRTHARSVRLFVNAGLRFPLCQAGAEKLNLDAGRWITTPDVHKVNCGNCLRIMRTWKENTPPDDRR